MHLPKLSTETKEEVKKIFASAFGVGASKGDSYVELPLSVSDRSTEPANHGVHLEALLLPIA
jgi:hypothetical protein